MSESGIVNRGPMKSARSRYQDGDVIDILVQPRGQGKEPFRIITDKITSYSAAARMTLCDRRTDVLFRNSVIRK
jgi:hypothetical protein